VGDDGVRVQKHWRRAAEDVVWDSPLPVANLINTIGLTVMDKGRHGAVRIEDSIGVGKLTNIVSQIVDPFPSLAIGVDLRHHVVIDCEMREFLMSSSHGVAIHLSKEIGILYKDTRNKLTPSGGNGMQISHLGHVRRTNGISLPSSILIRNTKTGRCLSANKGSIEFQVIVIDPRSAKAVLLSCRMALSDELHTIHVCHCP
jgi:hypothetical protein